MHHCLDARQARSMRHRVASSPLASAHPRSRAASDGTPHAPLVVRTQLATAGHALPRQGRAGRRSLPPPAAAPGRETDATTLPPLSRRQRLTVRAARSSTVPRLRIHVLLHQARLAAGVHRPRHRWHHPDCCRQYGGGPRRSGGRFPAHRAHGRLDRATRRPWSRSKDRRARCQRDLASRRGPMHRLQCWKETRKAASLIGPLETHALEMPVCTGAPQRDCPRIRRRCAGHALSTYPNPS